MPRDKLRKRLASRGSFVALPDDGATATFVPMTEPMPFEKEGFAGETREVYRVHVVTAPVDGDSTCQILDLSFKACRDGYDPSVPEGAEGKQIVKVTRHGVKGDTKTLYIFEMGKKLTSGQEKTAKQLYADFVKVAKDVPF